ncbi:uncharacterized protein [Odocoileus virginianus]|uniref:Uncharacterized protein isoform X1 n=1 Tax=Odocoileus virginianus TaxID=9874 RepID=A0A6J0W8D8_ODOVR
MVFGLCSQRERLYSLLYAIQIFILTGVAYYYFQGSVGKTAPAHEIAVESSQPIGETLRPVWGPMDKCYPVTTQRRRVRSGKKHDSEAVTPKAAGGPNDAASKEETAVLSREEVGPPGEEAASLIPGAKGVTEKEEVAGTPGWQVREPGAQLEHHRPVGPTGTPPGSAGWRGEARPMPLWQQWGEAGAPQDHGVKLPSRRSDSSACG